LDQHARPRSRLYSLSLHDALPILGGVLRVQPGMAQLAGLDPAVPAQRRLLPGKVGLVFQNSDDQLFNATVFDDVAFGPLNLSMPDRKSTRLNSSHGSISYAVFCLK